MEYKYIKISKCGNWIQLKQNPLAITNICREGINEIIMDLYRHNDDFSGFHKEEIDEIIDYIMNREVFAK
jgi:hypothetical protein